MMPMIGRRIDASIRLGDGSLVQTRHPRAATILLATHRGCDDCDALQQVLAARAGEIERRWATRIASAPADEDNLEALNLAAGEAAVIVIDRFGTVWEHHTSSRDDHSALPDPDAVEETAKFLGTMCPECGVPDWPNTGDWAV